MIRQFIENLVLAVLSTLTMYLLLPLVVKTHTPFPFWAFLFVSLVSGYVYDVVKWGFRKLPKNEVDKR